MKSGIVKIVGVVGKAVLAIIVIISFYKIPSMIADKISYTCIKKKI